MATRTEFSGTTTKATETKDATVSEAESYEIHCQSCGSALRISVGVRTATCPYCASPSVIHRPANSDRPGPTFVIGFAIDHKQASLLVQKWMAKSHFFARSDFKSATAKLTHGVYLPAYLYGAVANSRYSASIGENYTEIETYTATDSKGKPVTRTRTVTKTEYRDLAGHHSSYVVDVVVSASRGVSNDALEAIEPYDMGTLRRYDDSFIVGWMCEEPSRSRDACFQLAHNETVTKVGKMLQQFMPGDSFRNLQHSTEVENEVIDLALLPVWSYAVRYAEEKPPVQILVNGQTGRVGGKVPVSTTKVAFAVLVFLAIFVAIFLLFAAGAR